MKSDGKETVQRAFAGERGEEKKQKSYVQAGFTDLDELKFLVSVREK